MSQNILVTGAAGYIGGSVLADIRNKYSTAGRKHIFAAVRSIDQANAVSSSSVSVLRLNLADEQAVVDVICSNDISIVVHTASSIKTDLALHLVNGLSKQKKITGQPAYFIHTSALSAFYEKSGWPGSVGKDTDAIFQTEKDLADSYPIRQVEHARAVGVKTFIVVPSTVYGRGTGPWNQLSVRIPGFVQASLKLGKVYKFEESTTVQAVHIADLTALYRQIIHAILVGNEIPSGEEGYYFAVAHDINAWEFLDRLAAALKSRGLVADEKPDFFPSDEFAAEAVGVPVKFLGALWKSGGKFTASRPQRIGWKPEWDSAKFLDRVDDQVQDVLELGKAKSSLIDSLFIAAGETR
ncbi:hypothetical protein FGRMN_10361 [Fusarium graminum]|nr:hypothetical protein FGRMN_10361 [Fusarium graminum]